MAKIRTALSLLGSAKDAKKFAKRFDHPSMHLQPAGLFPPADVRLAVTEARMLLLRVTNAGDSNGDILTVVHVPASREGIAVFVFNPNIVVEADATLRELVDDAGYPVAPAIEEAFLGAMIDHVAELTMEALARLVDAVGPLSTYSSTAFSSHTVEFSEGTNHLDGAAISLFAAADPVDDAGHPRTRNQQAIIRTLVNNTGSAQAGEGQHPLRAGARTAGRRYPEGSRTRVEHSDPTGCRSAGHCTDGHRHRDSAGSVGTPARRHSADHVRSGRRQCAPGLLERRTVG